VKALDGEKAQRTHAEAAQQRADTEARKSSENEQQARRFLYASDMNLAQQSLKQNNLGKVRSLLERHRPKTGEEDLRGWEWRYLWQLTRSSALVTLTNRPVRGYSVSFSPDGTRLAVGWFDGGVDLWDVPGRRKIRALTEKKCDYSGKVAFAPKGNLLAATTESNTVALYDLDSGRESLLWRAPNPKVWLVRDLAFSSDGSKLVVFAETASDNDEGAVWIVNVASAQVESRHSTGRSPVGHTGAARISHDNRRLFLGHASGAKGGFRIECLELATGKEA
jgi:WD40 repeat protein